MDKTSGLHPESVALFSSLLITTPEKLVFSGFFFSSFPSAKISHTPTNIKKMHCITAVLAVLGMVSLFFVQTFGKPLPEHRYSSGTCQLGEYECMVHCSTATRTCCVFHTLYGKTYLLLCFFYTFMFLVTFFCQLKLERPTMMIKILCKVRMIFILFRA